MLESPPRRYSADPSRLLRPVVPTVYVRNLVALLADAGVTPHRVLRGAGVDAATLEQADARISLAQQAQIYRNAGRLYPADDLGIRLGRALRISDHGVYGYAISTSADLAQALRVVVGYAPVTGPLFDLSLSGDDAHTRVALLPLTDLGAAHRFAVDEVLTLFGTQVLTLCTPRVRPRAVEIDGPPRLSAAYRRLFDCQLLFERTRPAVVFDNADLLRPLTLSDAETAAICETRCAELLARLDHWDNIVDAVRRVVVDNPRDAASLDRVASRLHMSGRTLRRRLQASGLNFRALRDEVRLQLSLDYLRGSELPVEDIADLLGYSGSQNFYRAFRRWTGETPAAVRRRVSGPPDRTDP